MKVASTCDMKRIKDFPEKLRARISIGNLGHIKSIGEKTCVGNLWDTSVLKNISLIIFLCLEIFTFTSYLFIPARLSRIIWPTFGLFFIFILTLPFPSTSKNCRVRNIDRRVF